MDLTKGNPGLKKVNVALGWDENKFGGEDFDPDVSAIIIDANGKCPLKADDIVWYNMRRTKLVNGKVEYTTNDDPQGKLMHISGAVIHTGDNRTGKGSDKDKETIMVDLQKVPSNYAKIAYAITIYEATKRKQNFGMMENSFARVVDADTGVELARFELGESLSTETAAIIGEIYRHQGEWKFNAVGSGYKGGLNELVAPYGI